MTYPTLEQYNTALQHPETAFLDPELRAGSIRTTGLGLPLALCGGFALTYSVTVTAAAKSKHFAVRCFHKQSSELEQRYAGIANQLKQLQSPYFLDFEFQPHGIRVTGDARAYPIVKMDWAVGTTLGQFVEENCVNRHALEQLNASLGELAAFLDRHQMAHGDIQTGNVIVADGGQSLRLIDYDGMYVPATWGLGSIELGHRNFQHPLRDSRAWDVTLDRFAFISLNLALRVLCDRPHLWEVTHSESDGTILFRANDFADPDRSTLFGLLRRDPVFTADAERFAQICQTPLANVPSLADFLAGRTIPVAPVVTAPALASPTLGYLPAYPVLDAADFAACLPSVGDKVELIGRIVEVRQAFTRHGKPYTHINFGRHQADIVQVAIWSEGLAKLMAPVDRNWEGKWVSARGLINPPYCSRRYRYMHLSMTLIEAGQLQEITQDEAHYRLASRAGLGQGTPAHVATNQGVLDHMRGPAALIGSNARQPLSGAATPVTVPASGPVTGPVSPAGQTGQGALKGPAASGGSSQSPLTKNQAVLKAMHNGRPALPSRLPPMSATGAHPSQLTAPGAIKHQPANPTQSLQSLQPAAMPTSVPNAKLASSTKVVADKWIQWLVIIVVGLVVVGCLLLFLRRL